MNKTDPARHDGGSGAALDRDAVEASSDRNAVLRIRKRALEVRLAESAEEIDAAQALRFRVFYDEMKARPTPDMLARHRDFDPYDEVADHLLVIDHDRGGGTDAVVGTYRLIRREAARRIGRFYTEDEYDISCLISYEGEILELGRSCIASEHRNRRTMSLLWKGLGAYIWHHDIALMFGCASLPGTDPRALAEPLSYLYHNHLAPPALRTRAVAERYVDMNMVPASAVTTRQAVSFLPSDITTLPPLIKGYLRVGAFVGDGAVIDHQFNTTDVCVIVKTDLISAQYYKQFVAKPGHAHAAKAE